MPAAMSIVALPRAILRLSIAISCGVGIACSTVLCDRSRPNLAPGVSLRECISELFSTNLALVLHSEANR